MASSTAPQSLLSASSPAPFTSSSSFGYKQPFPRHMIRTLPTRTQRRRSQVVIPILTASSSPQGEDDALKSTKLVTFLGKGGSGKTTTAVFAAQHFAMMGLKTCLIIHSQDPTVDYLLNSKIGTSPVSCSNNLSAMRLETTKMLLEPLNKLKQADAHLNITQGVLEEVVGEELGVLPGMDSIFSALTLEKVVGFYGNGTQRYKQQDKFDIIIYDGLSSDEILRLMGASSKARLYLKYLRNLAEKTDLGRLAGPSILRLVDETLSVSGRGAYLDGRTSADIWESLEQTLEEVSSVLAKPHRFACFLVIDPSSISSLNSALRYWGCAIQADVHVSGAFCVASNNFQDKLFGMVKERITPLPSAFIPHLSMDSPPNWNEVIPNALSNNACNLLSSILNNGSVTHSISFDSNNKTIILFMPGFDKSEIKLYQYRGKSELLVEAGDQRRVICLPPQMQGKVAGAKFRDRKLVISLR